MICYDFNIMILNIIISNNKNQKGNFLVSLMSRLDDSEVTLLLIHIIPATISALRTLPSSPFGFGWTRKQEGKKEGGLGEGIFALPYLVLNYFRFPLIKKRELLILLKYMMKFLTTMSMMYESIVKILRIFFKESSNFVQKTQPTITFCKIIRGFPGALRLAMVFFRYNPGIFEVAGQGGFEL